ncbi:MAG: hypothetical protein BAJATHORv1_10630 [Candidatus Thorarchaeota archaeon]|nr:MAG: hypothetical protein BAJATHORv1_10630 [Candidatus Thorarchaeota archaeon]
MIGTSGNGSAIINNADYWTAPTLTIETIANVSVSFEYEVRLLTHHFSNSSWTTDPTKKGIAYSIEEGTSSSLSGFIYLGASSEYVNHTMLLEYPADWDNITIFDPFLNDVSSQCTIEMGLTIIPTSLLDRLGWWNMLAESPNYAKSISVQKYNSSSTTWFDATTFRCGNISRSSIEIGTTITMPTLENAINVSVILPNGTVWAQDSVFNTLGNSINTTSWTFSGLNTTAGQWRVECFWNNGTEVAFDSSQFALHHSTILTPIHSLIETEAGLVVTSMLQYIDTDTGQYLMDESASIDGSWTGGSVSFSPNLVRNWWEGDFDTSLVQNGYFTVIVNASRPYFDDASCQFAIEIFYPTIFNIEEVSDTPVESHYGLTELFNLTYTFENGTGIAGADIGMSFSGPTNGLVTIGTVDNGDGNYSIDFSSLETGTYTVTLSGAKSYFETSQESFTLIVSSAQTAFSCLNGTSDFIETGQSYHLAVQFENITGFGLSSANIQITSVSPDLGLSYDVFVDEGDGVYSIELTPSLAQTYTIVFKANLTNHESQTTTFVLAATAIPTTFGLNVSSVSVGITDTLSVQASFSDLYFNGLAGAAIGVIDQPSEVSIEISDNTDGNYTLLISSDTEGTYLLKFSASLDNYQTSYASFSLIIDPIGSTLELVNGTSDISQVDEEYRLVLRYANSTNYGISGATLVISDVSPTAGLVYTTFSESEEGYYSILLTPTYVETFTIVISANASNHISRSVTFTLRGSEIPTLLTLNTSSSTIGVSDELSVLVSYSDFNENGLENATVEVVNPTSGISISITENGDGNYTLVVNPSISGSYLVTLSAILTNYQERVTSFSVVVGEISTTLQILNGTSGMLRYGETYSLVLEYSNNTGYGLDGANITLLSTEPISGILVDTAIPLGNGLYQITLRPNLTGTYVALFQANLTNYVTKSVTFTLTVSNIPTVLTIDQSGMTVSVDQECHVQLTFRDENSLGLIGATVTCLDIPEGVSISSAVDSGNGRYNLSINSLFIGTYQLAFRATLPNYQNSTVGFTLIVQAIPTMLSIVGDITAETLRYLEDYELALLFERLDTASNISGADITISSIPSSGLIWTIEKFGEMYLVKIETNTTGSWNLYITASKENYIDAATEFTLEIDPITTSINEYTLLESLYYGRFYNLSFNYLMYNQTPVTGAAIDISGSASAWAQVTETTSGPYNLSIIPIDVGTYDIILTFSKDGFVTCVSEFEFTVQSITIQIVDIEGLNGFEGELTTLSLRLVERDSRKPVSDAIVQFQIFTETGPQGLRDMTEFENGLYSASIILPSSTDSARIRFYVEMDHHEMDESYSESVINSQVSQVGLMNRTLLQVSPFLLIVGAITTLYFGKRLYSSRKREQNIEAMLVKRKFDDLQSILGVIVLHRYTGIPIFSKMVRKGLDETLISGFISAVTQFRSEFGVDQETFRVNPISDIIRVVVTENLICAFITSDSPTKSLELRMMEFAEIIGFVFDRDYTEPPSRALEKEKTLQFESVFDEVMDGHLLRKHIITNPDALPKGPKCIDAKIDAATKDGAFELRELAASMTACGIEEAKAYKIIWDAIKKKHIVIAEPEETGVLQVHEEDFVEYDSDESHE